MAKFLNKPSLFFKRGSGAIFIVLVLFLLAGLTGVLASRTWDPLWNPFRPSPNEVIKRMGLEMEKVKTCQEKMEISLTGRNEGRFEIRLNTEGKTDMTQSEKPESESRFNLVASLTEEGKPMGAKFALGGEAKVKDEVFYLKFTTLPTIPFLAMAGIDLSQIKDQWIKIDQDSMMKMAKEMAGEEWTPEMEKIYGEQSEKQKVLQKELQEKIKKALKGKKLFVVKKEFPDEKIGNVMVYHYLVALNKEGVLKVVSEMAKILEETMLKEYGTAPTFREKEFKEKLNGFLEKVGEIKGEVWIGKKDYLLYRVKGKKDIDLSKLNKKEEGSISIGLNLEYSEFNKPVKIEPPSEYKEINEILPAFFQNFFQKSILPGKDARIKADINQARALAEMIYFDENSYKNLCRNYTLNESASNYGKQLAEIEKDIRSQQGGVLRLSCYSSKTSYCITADLASPGKGRYCVDSSGAVREIAKNSNCLGNGTSKNPYRCPKERIFLENPTQSKEPSLFQASVLEGLLKLLGK